MKMKKAFITSLSLFLCLCFGLTTVAAAEKPTVQQAEESFCELAGCKPGELLAQKDWFIAGTSVSDWMAFVFAINGLPEKYDEYLSDLEQYVTEKYESDGGLSKVLATEYHRIALTVLALGGDPRAFGTDAAGQPVDLIADGTWKFEAGVGKQGLNGLIYALIALDAKDYETPADAVIDREWLLEQILSHQSEDGGFGFLPGSSDVDLTAMTLTALAPHKDTYTEQIEKALSYLSLRQSDSGQYASFGDTNAESAAQVVIALCSLDIDPETDTRFIQNGVTLLDVLDYYRLNNGTYSHVADDSWDAMATEQVLLALTALNRMHDGKPGIYSFTDYQTEVNKDSGAPAGIIIAASAAIILIVITLALIITRRRRKENAEAHK